MPDLVVELNISKAQLLSYYRGQTRSVRAHATNGQVVQFPASLLQKHVALDGIHGRFRIEFDGNQKLVRFERLVPST
jgi:hypothetical protein